MNNTNSNKNGENMLSFSSGRYPGDPHLDGIPLRGPVKSTVSLGYHIGTVAKKMETTIVHCGYIGIMEKKMETTIMGYMHYLTPGRYLDRLF